MTGAGSRAYRMWVNGRVQGVGFRWFVRRTALGLGLTGRVRNLPDGRVEVEAAGPSDRLDAFRQQLREGSSGARVTRLDEVELSGVPPWDGFEIDR